MATDRGTNARSERRYDERHDYRDNGPGDDRNGRDRYGRDPNNDQPPPGASSDDSRTP
jgi:hypothetical protein